MLPQVLRQLLKRSFVVRLLLATIGYGVVVTGSLYLVPAGGSGASLVWPPAAAGVALLFFGGLELWPAIAIAFFVTLFAHDISPPLTAITAIANVLESVVGAYLLRNYVGFSPHIGRLRDALGLILSSFVSTLISASVITIGVGLINHNGVLNGDLWVGIWIGHLVSLISMAPFVLRWGHRPFFHKTRNEVLEGLAIFGSITVLTFFLFWTPYGSIGIISLLYILIIPLIWAALRAGPRGMSLALFIIALGGAAGILFGFGPITHSANLPQALFGVQMIIGTLAFIFLPFTSITEERKEAVTKLERHVGELEVALQKISSEDQAKSDFIAILAHELRNPLSPILSGLELLKSKQHGPPDVLHMMGAHLHTVARLLDDLLDMSRISQKRLKLQREPVEIHAVMAQTVEMVKPYLDSREHHLQVELPQKEVWVDGDPVRLSQIFVNLLNNAAKYTDPGGTIVLSVTEQHGEVVVRVRDTGIGIEAERLNKIFEPFGASEKTERRPGGLHIGLSLAKRIAEMHSGSIAVYSKGPGQGTEFVVRLPIPQERVLPFEGTLKRIRGRFSKNSIAPRGGLTVLVVDDNEPAAQGLALLLKNNGHTVTVAYTGAQAIRSAMDTQPQVALLDIGLPDMDGHDLATKLRERFGDKLALVALTGYGQEQDRQKALRVGFAEHLIKPVSIVDVERVLQELF